jgi:DNA-binding LacI/PurR family transcriptional regulator
MDGIERRAEELGFGVLVQFTPSPDAAMELRSLRTALEHQVDGIIWLPGNLVQENVDCASVMESLHRMRKPVVLLESAVAQLPTAPVVDFDYPSAFREALVHLTTQGYRRVDFLHIAGVASAQSIRGQQFIAQAQALKIPSEIVALADPKNLKAELLRRQAQKEPQALLFENDWLGIQTLQAARDLQVAVPREIGLCVIGDLLLGNELRIGELPSPGLTAIRRPFGDMARRAVELLVAAINRVPVNVKEPLLPMSFIPRQSTFRKIAETAR